MEKFENGSEEKKFTKDELLKVALKYIDSMENYGSIGEKADTKKMKEEELSRVGERPFFTEESITKALKMVESGEAEKIARLEYKGGI